MNLELRVVARNLGLLILVLSALIALIAGFAAYDGIAREATDRADGVALALTALIGAIMGGLLFLAGRSAAGRSELLGRREALLLVGMSWLLGAILSALPYSFWASFRSEVESVPHDFDHFINCFFESMSGLTTTGATILQSIDTLPRSLLLWRSLTHWLGGLGIVVLFVAVLPMLGVGSRRVYRIEAAGPTPEGVKPRIQDAARILWYIYTGLTVAELIALRLCGMSWFDATCHTFATLATGGFSTSDESIAAFPSAAIHTVVIVFMLLAGVNFGLYYQLLRRDWRGVRKDPELRVYLSIILVATAIVTISLSLSPQHTASAGGAESSFIENARDGLFQVISIQTTTGFCSKDFDQWAFPAKATLLILMFIGASAGSTGGGIKVIRIMIAAKVVLAEIEHTYRPNVVRPVKIGRTIIDAELKRNILVYFVGMAILFAVGTILLMFFESGNEIDITTASTASAATLNNIGPGLARVGATHNYAWFGAPSKLVMTLLMLLGRLEMFTIVALLTPRFWREE